MKDVDITMLNIWHYRDIEYMKDAPPYFDNVYEDEWIEAPFVQAMIQVSAHVIESPVLGVNYSQRISWWC